MGRDYLGRAGGNFRVKLSALADEATLVFVGDFERTMEFVELLPEALEGLVRGELGQDFLKLLFDLVELLIVNLQLCHLNEITLL